jgi:hypothetical protein
MKQQLITIGKILFPSILIITGLFVLYLVGSENESVKLIDGSEVQKVHPVNFITGAILLTMAGIIGIVINFVNLNKVLVIVLSVFLLVASLIPIYLGVSSVYDEIEITKKNNDMNTEIKQNMVDLRNALKIYRSEYDRYPTTLDSLIYFIRTASYTNVVTKGSGQIPYEKAISERYDSTDTDGKLRLRVLGMKNSGDFSKWDDEKAMKLKNYYLNNNKMDQMPYFLKNFTIDTLETPMLVYLYLNDDDIKAREVFGAKLPFDLESLKYVPYSEQREFYFKSCDSVVSKDEVYDLNVYILKDMKPIIPGDTLKLGSLNSTSDIGSWEIKN